MGLDRRRLSDDPKPSTIGDDPTRELTAQEAAQETLGEDEGSSPGPGRPAHEQPDGWEPEVRQILQLMNSVLRSREELAVWVMDDGELDAFAIAGGAVLDKHVPSVLRVGPELALLMATVAYATPRLAEVRVRRARNAHAETLEDEIRPDPNPDPPGPYSVFSEP